MHTTLMSYSSSLSRSVYLLGDGMLFDAIITHMLTSVASLRVMKRVYEGDTLFLSEVNGQRPDVILLTETSRFRTEQLLHLLSRMPLTADLRIIVLSVRHNNIQILDRSAGGNPTQTGVPRLLRDIDDWNQLLDLVIGKQLHCTDSQ